MVHSGQRDRVKLDYEKKSDNQGLTYTTGTPIIQKIADKFGKNPLYTEYAEKATQNANKTSVMLGKYNQDGISYIIAAKEKGATYFNLDNWNEVASKIGESNMWEINKRFLEQQLQQGKIFFLSHNPATATGYFRQEVDFLRENGFKFIKDGNLWKGVK